MVSLIIYRDKTQVPFIPNLTHLYSISTRVINIKYTLHSDVPFGIPVKKK